MGTTNLRRLATTALATLALAAPLTVINVAMATAPAQAASVPLDPISSTAPIEGYVHNPQITTGYAGNVCFGRLRDGARAAYNYMDSLFGWPTPGTLYACRLMDHCGFTTIDPIANPGYYSDCWSNHAQGRAIDLMVGGNAPDPTPLGRGNALVNWLFQADASGNHHARARRLGVQQIIWNNRCWSTSRSADRGITTASAMRVCNEGHYNHVHLDLTVAGANGLTSAYNAAEESPRPKGVPGRADVNGDGKEDLVAQNADSVWVKLSTGSSFAAPTQWSSAGFYGSTANHAGDINGDGKADLVAQNGDSVWVMLSTGSSFGTPVQWSSAVFYGSTANHTGDINGDGKADLVAQNGDSVWVMVSTGSSFGTPVQWSSAVFYGDTANHIGDINGDGKTDLIAQNEDSVWVMLSTGSSFSPPAQWSSMPFYGSTANHVGDINGDGKAELVAHNAGSVWAILSTGSSFSSPAEWATGEFHGDTANHVGDINGDGKADLIAQNAESVWVKLSTGSSMGAPAQWATGAFAGSVANHG
jgi:FG-GAP-like repeat